MTDDSIDESGTSPPAGEPEGASGGMDRTGKEHEPPAEISNELTGNQVVFHRLPEEPMTDSLVFDVVIEPGFDGKLFELDRRGPDQSQHLTVTSGIVTGFVHDRDRLSGGGRGGSPGVDTSPKPVVLVPGDEYRVEGPREVAFRNGSQESAATVRVSVSPALDTERFIRRGYEEGNRRAREAPARPPRPDDAGGPDAATDGPGDDAPTDRSDDRLSRMVVPTNPPESVVEGETAPGSETAPPEPDPGERSRLELSPSVAYLRDNWSRDRRRLLVSVAIGGAFFLLMGVVQVYAGQPGTLGNLIVTALSLLLAVPALGYLAAVFRRGMAGEPDLPTFGSLGGVFARDRLEEGLLVAAIQFVSLRASHLAGTIFAGVSIGILFGGVNSLLLSVVFGLFMLYVAPAVLGLILEERRLTTVLKFTALGKRLAPAFRSRVYLSSVLTVLGWLLLANVLLLVFAAGGSLFALVGFGVYFAAMIPYYHFLGRLWAELRARGLVGDPVPETKYEFNPRTDPAGESDVGSVVGDSGGNAPR
jgi:hypothetical protein